jgi:hypothetical protein
MFDDFFQEHSKNLIVGKGGVKKDGVENWETLKLLPLESFIFDRLRAGFFWKKFNSAPNTGSPQIFFNWKFSETGYSVISEFESRPPAASFSKVFGEYLSEQEQTTLVQAVSSQFLHYIRLIADEAGYDIPDFTSNVPHSSP